MDTALEPQLVDNTKQKLYTLFVKMHRAYGKQKNKACVDATKKQHFEGGYDAVKRTILIFNNVSSVEDLKGLVKIEAKRYKSLADEERSADKNYAINVGMYRAYKQILAGILYIDDLDVDNHNVLRSEVIDFDYAS